jgi:hypothetical protein
VDLWPNAYGLIEDKWREWVASRPENVRVWAEKLPPCCYRHAGQPSGHYWLYSFDVGQDDTVTVKLVHGSDSFMPGFAVFGVDPADLIPCNCSGWLEGTPMQAEDSTKKADAMIEKHGRPPWTRQ